jgi:hypothetical protein
LPHNFVDALAARPLGALLAARATTLLSAIAARKKATLVALHGTVGAATVNALDTLYELYVWHAWHEHVCRYVIKVAYYYHKENPSLNSNSSQHKNIFQTTRASAKTDKVMSRALSLLSKEKLAVSLRAKDIREAIVDRQPRDASWALHQVLKRDLVERASKSTLTYATLLRRGEANKSGKPAVVDGFLAVDASRTLWVALANLAATGLNVEEELDYGLIGCIFTVKDQPFMIMKLGGVQELEAATAVLAGTLGLGPLVLSTFDLPTISFIPSRVGTCKGIVMERLGSNLREIFVERKLSLEEWTKLSQLPLSLFSNGIFHTDLHFGNVLALNRDALHLPVAEWRAIDFADTVHTARDACLQFCDECLPIWIRWVTEDNVEESDSGWDLARKQARKQYYNEQESAAIVALFSGLSKALCNMADLSD